MAYPILAPQQTWYTQGNSGVAVNTFTAINIVDSYTPTGNETKTWDASAAKDGSITCYISGTTLIIAGNGSGKIALSANASSCFRDFKKVTAISGSNLLDLSNVTNMSYAFWQCSALTSLDVSTWNVSKVTQMDYLFGGCSALPSLNVSSWDVSSAINMLDMFTGCKSLTSLDISAWNVSKVTDMAYMFNHCESLTSLDISNWDVSKVTDMGDMFEYCNALTTLNINNWDVSKVTNMRAMFQRSGIETLDISNWNFSSIKYMSSMFASCSQLSNLNISIANTSQTVYMAYMFFGCSALASLDVSAWNVGNVISMAYMFTKCSALTSLDVSSWNVGNVTNMQGMFQNSALISLDVSKWNTSNVTDMSCLFNMCSALTSLDVSNWDVSKVTTMSGMFDDCTKLAALNVSAWNTGKVTRMDYMFAGCRALTSLDVSNWDVSKVTNMEAMFQSNESYMASMKITDLDISKWDTSSCTNMSFMFYGFNNNGTLDVSNLNTSKVTNFDHMFAHSHLAGLNVSKWDTSSAINMDAMFHSTFNTSYDVSGFDTSKVQHFAQMFESCVYLKSIKGLENFDTSKGVSFDEMFNNCPSLKKLNLSSFNTKSAKDNVTVSTNGHKSRTLFNIFNGCTSLEEVTFGENFSFNGDGTTTVAANVGVLPTPSKDKIPYANGKWYDVNGNGYLAKDIPSCTAMTYYASKSVLYKDGLITQYGAIADIADAFRDKLGNSDELTLSGMVTSVSDVYEAGKTDGYSKGRIEGSFIKLSDNLYDASKISASTSWDDSTGEFFTGGNGNVTDYIAVRPGEKYIGIENQTYELPTGKTSRAKIAAYDSSKTFIKNIYSEERALVTKYYHAFEIPENAAYIKMLHRKTDANIQIYKTQNKLTSRLQQVFYTDDSWTQGICVSDDYAFISCSTSKGTNPNDYVIKKIDLSTGDLVSTSAQTYNHANGMTYNPKTNKIIVCALDGTATLTTTVSDLDYSLYVVNPDTFEIENTINLKQTVLGVCSGSVGISGVAYNPYFDEYYALTRYPTRYIIILDQSFQLKDFFFMLDYTNEYGTRGDICTDGNLIYSPNFRSDMGSLINEVSVYTRSGVLLGIYSVSGVHHIESMDIKNGYYYLNFIYYDGSVSNAKTYKTNGIFDLYT